jgi:hypothetical protein
VKSVSGTDGLKMFIEAGIFLLGMVCGFFTGILTVIWWLEERHKIFIFKSDDGKVGVVK